MFKISDIEFGIESAILDAYIDKKNMQIKWGVEVKAKSGKNIFFRWKPKVESEIFAKNTPGQLKHWLDLDDVQMKWKEPYNVDNEPYAMLYVFEHQPIQNGSIDISNKNNLLNIRWTGKSDVNWDSKYGRALDIFIETELFFKGIWFGRESEADCKPILSSFFDPDLFEFVQTEHGVSLFKPV